MNFQPRRPKERVSVRGSPVAHSPASPSQPTSSSMSFEELGTTGSQPTTYAPALRTEVGNVDTPSLMHSLSTGNQFSSELDLLRSASPPTHLGATSVSAASASAASAATAAQRRPETFLQQLETLEQRTSLQRKQLQEQLIENEALKEEIHQLKVRTEERQIQLSSLEGEVAQYQLDLSRTSLQESRENADPNRNSSLLLKSIGSLGIELSALQEEEAVSLHSVAKTREAQSSFEQQLAAIQRLHPLNAEISALEQKAAALEAQFGGGDDDDDDDGIGMSLGGEVANLLLQLNAEKREYDSKQESIAMVRREIADLNNNIAALRTRRPFFAQSSEAEADLKKLEERVVYRDRLQAQLAKLETRYSQLQARVEKANSSSRT